MLIICVCIMEVGLSMRGIQPSLLDSSSGWQKQRARVDALGPQALALVGASRILLDTDIDTLRHASGLEPVQLAIEGSSFVPVLAGLAGDDAFRGSVIVEMDISTLALPAQFDAAYEYQQDYARDRRVSNYLDIEASLVEQLHSRLRSYADGERPLTALQKRLLRRPDPVQYLKMLPDREVLADYRRAPMPYLYFLRSLRNLDGSLDLPSGFTYRQIGEKIEAGIAELQPVDDARFLSILPAVDDMVHAIQARGGQVWFVEFPEDGYVKDADDRRYPRPLFWDRLAGTVKAPAVNFEDVADLRRFQCPDGSHLDYRARPAFTRALAVALRLASTP